MRSAHCPIQYIEITAGIILFYPLDPLKIENNVNSFQTYQQII